MYITTMIYNILSVTRQLTSLFSKKSKFLIFVYLLSDLQAYIAAAHSLFCLVFVRVKIRGLLSLYFYV